MDNRNTESVLFSRVWRTEKRRKNASLVVTVTMPERVKWGIEHGDFIYWKITGVRKQYKKEADE